MAGHCQKSPSRKYLACGSSHFRPAFIVLGIIFLGILTACGTENNQIQQIEQQSDDGIYHIVTSIPPLASITENIFDGIEKVEVMSLLSSGDSIETFSLTPEDIEAVRKADAYVTFGTEIEPYSALLISQIDVKKTKVITVGEIIERVPGMTSPYILFDLERGSIVADNIREGFSEIFPDREETIRHNAAFFQYQSAAVMSGLKDRFEKSPRKKVVLLTRNYEYFLSSIPGLSDEITTVDLLLPSGDEELKNMIESGASATYFLEEDAETALIDSIQRNSENTVVFISPFEKEVTPVSYQDHVYFFGEAILKAFGEIKPETTDE